MTAQRLSQQQLAHLPAQVVRPAYQRDEHGVGNVHLGIGAFHRAHQAAYTERVLQRFANSSVHYRTGQAAMDGSQKLPQRLLSTVGDQLARGGEIRLLSLAVAAWMRYVSGFDEHGRPIDVADPLADRLKAICGQHGDNPPRMAQGLMAVREVFGEDLPQASLFVREACTALSGLYEYGTRNLVKRALNEIV